jgi:hypothetical protein
MRFTQPEPHHSLWWPFRQVPHDQVEPHAFDPPHLDRIGPLGLQVRMLLEPADHVLGHVRHVRVVPVLVGLKKALP